MFHNFNRLIKILKITDIKGIPSLLIVGFLNAFFELISIGILIPFATLVIDNDSYFTFQNILKNQNFLNLNYFVDLNQKDFILSLTLLAILLFILKFLINFFYIWYVNTKKIIFENLIATKVLKNLSEVNNISVLKIGSSDFIHSMTGRLSFITTSLVCLINLVVEFTVLFFIFLFLLIKYPSQSLFFIIFITFFLLIIYFVYRKIIFKWSLERGKAGDLRTQNLMDFFLGIREVIINFIQESFIGSFNKVNKEFLITQKKLLISNSFPRILIELILALTFLLIVFYFVLYDYNFKNMLLSISITLILCLRIFPSLNRILFNFNQFKFAIEPIQNISKILIKSESIKNKKEQALFESEIIFENLFYNFDNKNLILENLDFKIKRGDKIAIIGETGSGKTTLADILTGLIKPTKGNIFIDGKNLNTLDLNSWLKKISYVSQKIFLFNVSIRENITLKKDIENIDEKKFLDILKICHLSNFINSKDKKELFQVGEFGSSLSGGQKQKIGLARALYKNSELIILDESTNALDEKNEEIVIKNILDLRDKTIIFITHNIKNTVHFDKTFIIKEKKIIEY